MTRYAKKSSWHLAGDYIVKAEKLKTKRRLSTLAKKVASDRRLSLAHREDVLETIALLEKYAR